MEDSKGVQGAGAPLPQDASDQQIHRGNLVGFYLCSSGSLQPLKLANTCL